MRNRIQSWTYEWSPDSGVGLQPVRFRKPFVPRWSILLCFLVALLPFGKAFAQESARVDTRISADSVRIGERFPVILAAEHAVGTEVIFPTPQEEESRLFGDLRVMRRGPVQKGRSAEGRRVDSVAYQVTTFALDSARVPPLSLRVVAGTDTTRVNSSSRIVPVISMVDAEAKGLREPAALASFPWPLWTWIVLGLVVTALLAGLAYVWWRRRRRSTEPENASQSVESEGRSPYEAATADLRHLQQRDSSGSEAVKILYVDLADILRTYLARELGIAALERTTPELVELLDHRPDVSKKAVGHIQAVLELADLVKFAGRRPSPEETQQALQEARAAIDAVRTTPRSAEQTLTEEARPPL